MSVERPEYYEIDGSEFNFAIVASRYNKTFVDTLCDRVVQTLTGVKVPEENIDVLRVPGAMELPYVAAMQAASGGFDCVIALGVVIAGDTQHHSVIEMTTAQSFQSIGIQYEIPVINGVLTVGSIEQAEERITGGMNRGEEFARAALEMAQHRVEFAEALESSFELSELEDFE